MDRGTEVFSTYCQSHTGNVPFHTMSGLLRAVFGIDELDVDGARERVRTRLPDADAEDLVLLDDLLGIRASATELPVVDPEARRRRLTRLVETAVNDERSRGVRDRGRALDRRGQRIHLVDFVADGFWNARARPHHPPSGVPGCAESHLAFQGNCPCSA